MFRLDRNLSTSSVGSAADDYTYEKTKIHRDVIRIATPPPVIHRVVERARTPEPEVIERVIVRPQPQQVIEKIIERPRTPPPKIINTEVNEPAPAPIVRTRY